MGAVRTKSTAKETRSLRSYGRILEDGLAEFARGFGIWTGKLIVTQLPPRKSLRENAKDFPLVCSMQLLKNTANHAGPSKSIWRYVQVYF